MVLFILSLVGMYLVGFLQNMIFTLSSRSRNSGDPDYHKKVAYWSNGIWYAMQFFSAGLLFIPMNDLKEHLSQGLFDITFVTVTIIKILLVGFIYIHSTSNGSSMMMRINLGHDLPKWAVFLRKIKVIDSLIESLVEKGNKRVGK